MAVSERLVFFHLLTTLRGFWREMVLLNSVAVEPSYYMANLVCIYCNKKYFTESCRLLKLH